MIGIEIAIVSDENTKMHYVYGTYEEVEEYAERLNGWVLRYFDHVNPSTVQSKFTYVGKGNDPYQTSRTFNYLLKKLVDIEKW